VVEDDKKVLDGDDGTFDVRDRQADNLGDFLPGFVDVLALVDVELAAVGPQGVPDLVV
jgi:hypothetical protein